LGGRGREGDVQQIIDFHSHLGDILHPEGGALIARRGVSPDVRFDLTALAEARLHRDALGLGRWLYRWTGSWVTRVERARNATATHENFDRSLSGTGIVHSVVLPVPPYVRFADLRPFAERDPRIVAFTGVDFGAEGDPAASLGADVEAGARGLKLHPIIQSERLSSPRTLAAVEAFSAHSLPVLFHCGVASYYVGRDRRLQQPANGRVSDAVALVRSFPGVRFVVGHSGLFQVDDVLEQLRGFSNVWVESSFQSVARLRELLQAFGPERVLFGSDWPFGRREPALAIARAACDGDAGLERRVAFDNAAELLGLA
jgi:hypothetical protein